MSIDLIAHFGVTRDDLTEQRLIDHLNSGCPNLTRFDVDWVQEWTRQTNSTPVRWERCGKIGPDALFSVFGPNCVLSVLPKRARFFDGTRWGYLWNSPKYRQLLRFACLDLARLLGSRVAIYTPEVFGVEGETVEQVEQFLRREWGDAAPTFEALAGADRPDIWEAIGCWYVDDFSDLVRPVK